MATNNEQHGWTGMFYHPAHEYLSPGHRDKLRNGGSHSGALGGNSGHKDHRDMPL